MKKHALRIIFALMLCLSLLMNSLAMAQPRSSKSSGGRLIISEAGEYTLTGSMRGTIYVDPGAGNVTLIFDNVTLDGGSAPAIIGSSGASLNLHMTEGSQNAITSSGTAAIQSTVNTVFEGAGSMNISGGQDASVQVHDASLCFCDGSYSVIGSGTPIQADRGYTIQSGHFLALGLSSMQLPINQSAQSTVLLGTDAPVPASTPVSLMDTLGNSLVCFDSSQPFTTFLYSDGALTNDRYDLFAGQSLIGSITAPDYVEPVQIAVKPTTSQKTDPTVPSSGSNSQPSDRTEAPDMDAAQPEQPETPTEEQSIAPAESDDNAPSGQMSDSPELPAKPIGDVPGEQSAQPSGEGASTASDRPGSPSNRPTNQTQPSDPNQPGMANNTTSASSDAPSEIVTSTAVNTAASLEADYDNATYITMTDEDSQVKVTSSGTYVITGSSSDGNITVKKGTTGVVLVLDDLDLTSTSGATVSINKQAEVKIIVSGDVTLTDAENPEDENSTDEAIADAYDGAVIKAKADSTVYLTGDGTLTLNGEAKNGIKAGDDSVFTIDGDLTVYIDAENDGINTNHDLTILSGNLYIHAGDDGIHSDRILTLGSEDGTGPFIDITASTEGLEGTIVNIFGGNISVVSTDDGVNAANADAAFEDELDYAINMTGGSLTVKAGGDGLDSNGDINLIGGTTSISSASFGGEAGIDYDGEFYLSGDVELNNQSGVAGPDVMGQMNGPFGPGQQTAGADQNMPQMPGQQTADAKQTMPQMPGQQTADASQAMPQQPERVQAQSQNPGITQQGMQNPFGMGGGPGSF